MTQFKKLLAASRSTNLWSAVRGEASQMPEVTAGPSPMLTQTGTQVSEANSPIADLRRSVFIEAGR